MSTHHATVFVVDDDPVSLDLLHRILTSAGHAVEMFGRAEPLLSRVTASDRGCAVVDVKLPGLSGLELHAALHELGIHLPFVFVSGQANVLEAVAAMKQGAIDFLTKPVDSAMLRQVVDRALHRDANAAATREANEQTRARWELLSPRERDVCNLLKTGLLDKQVAAQLGVRTTTAHAQRRAAFKKLGIGSVAELIPLLNRLGGER